MLMIHLPLNGDLHNQGLANIEVTNNGATVDNNGKIGKCYSFDGTSKYISLTNPLTDASEISCSVWVKPLTNTSTNEQIINIGTSSGWTNIRFGILQRSINQFIFHVSDGTNQINYACVSDTITLNEWINIICTYKERTLKMYLNGELVKTYSISFDPSFSGISNIGIGAAPNGSEKFTGCINDVKIFSHCLSLKEISELKKLLILHYPLDNNGWGQENLIITNSMAPTSGTSGWSSAGSGWANSNVVSAGASNGHAIRCTYSGTTQVSGGIHHPTGVDKSTLTNGATYTLSARIRASKACIATFDNELMTVGNSVNLTTDWQIYTYSSAIDNTKTYQSNVIYVRATDATQNMWIECDWIKLEEGSIATPWCPNSSDELATIMGLNSTTEYDTSGFGNNGTRVGELSWTSDTPKYLASTTFNGNNGIFTHLAITLSHFTIAFWGKHSVKGKMLIGSNVSLTNTNGNWYWYGDNSFKYPNGEYYYQHNAGSIDSLLGKWTHFVATYNGEELTIYRNGINEGSQAVTGSKLLDYLSIGVGLSSSYWADGDVSDVRIYASCLSPEDILSLYQASAYIDSQGNTYASSYMEG